MDKIGLLLDDAKKKKKSWQTSKVLSQLAPPPALPGQIKGKAAEATTKKSGTSEQTTTSGYTSPLTESQTKARTYFGDRLFVSTDGLLCMIVKPLNEIYFNDSSTTPKEVKFILKEPVTP